MPGPVHRHPQRCRRRHRGRRRVLRPGAGTTTASTGTNGTTSNNAISAFPAPTANWGVITGFAIFDALTGGNMLIWAPLNVAKTVNNQDAAPSFPIAAFTFQIDN